jgi:23S rRNA (cytidine2498-2'-O)-methyltransferase
MNPTLMATLVATADPDFADLAQAEITVISPHARFSAPLVDGVWLVETAVSFFDLAAHWQQQPPIFLRHINPVQASLTLRDQTSDIHALNDLLQAELLDLVDPDLPFSVQARVLGQQPYKAYDLNQILSQTITAETGAPLNVRQPVQILSVVVGQGQGYLGLSLAAHNLSGWAGGRRRFARDKAQISRAEFKLLEAIEWFDIRMPPRGMVLDLGAAPGGWTRILRQYEQYVTAVDPARLHPNLQADPNVRHLAITAEEYLAADPDQFDLIFNDMRLDARDSARLMAAYARCLYRHGVALITLKLPQENRQTVLDHSFNILRRAYTITAARQLFHNRSEITVYLHPKSNDKL